MLRREYFISTRANLPDGSVNYSWRQFYSVSWFARPVDELNWILKDIAEDLGLQPEDLSVITFNRC